MIEKKLHNSFHIFLLSDANMSLRVNIRCRLFHLHIVWLSIQHKNVYTWKVHFLSEEITFTINILLLIYKESEWAEKYIYQQKQWHTESITQYDINRVKKIFYLICLNWFFAIKLSAFWFTISVNSRCVFQKVSALKFKIEYFARQNSRNSIFSAQANCVTFIDPN